MPKTKKCVNENWKKLILKHPELKKKKEKKSKMKPELAMALEMINKKEEGEPKNWFDGVDDIFLENDIERTTTKRNVKEEEEDKKVMETVHLNGYDPLAKNKSSQGLTRVIAMDCEMVGVGEGGKESILARISLVNRFGQCIYDKFVKPTEPVTDYRTFVSGVRPEDLEKGEDFRVVQREVFKILENRVLVGHALQNDFKVLFLDHPKKMIRDTAQYKPFKRLFNGQTPSLKRLTERLLGVGIQSGEHSSVQDAQAAMRLYTMHKKDWEKKFSSKWKRINERMANKISKTQNQEINGKTQKPLSKKKIENK